MPSTEGVSVLNGFKQADENKNNQPFMLGIGTYADNATALAAGLVAGDVYKTAAGELRIVV